MHNLGKRLHITAQYSLHKEETFFLTPRLAKQWKLHNRCVISWTLGAASNQNWAAEAVLGGIMSLSPAPYQVSGVLFVQSVKLLSKKHASLFVKDSLLVNARQKRTKLYDFSFTVISESAWLLTPPVYCISNMLTSLLPFLHPFNITQYLCACLWGWCL